MPKHLQRMANGEWRVRVVVPKALVARVGQGTFTRLLKTKDEGEAEVLSRQWVARFKEKITQQQEQQVLLKHKRWYWFYPDPKYDHPSNAVHDYLYDIEEIGDYGTRKEGLPSLTMVPLFNRSGKLIGYRSRKPDDPPAGIVMSISLWATYRASLTRKTWKALVGKLTRVANYLGHDCNIFLVSAEDLAGYPEYLLAQGLRPRVVDDHLLYIRSIFKALKDLSVIDSDPAEHLRRT